MYVNRFFSKILASQATLKFEYKSSSCYVKEKKMKDMLLKINGTPIEQVKYTNY